MARLEQDPLDTTTLTLIANRQALYHSFTEAQDTLFNFCNTLATHPTVRSVVELSQVEDADSAWNRRVAHKRSLFKEEPMSVKTC